MLKRGADLKHKGETLMPDGISPDFKIMAIADLEDRLQATTAQLSAALTNLIAANSRIIALERRLVQIENEVKNVKATSDQLKA